MKIKEIIEILNANLLTGEENLDMNITSGCGADLMSDVMAYVKQSVILLTGLINTQVVRTAEMMDIEVICFVRGKIPGEDVINLAKDRGIMVLTTEDTLFIACGKLYEAGIIGRGT